MLGSLLWGRVGFGTLSQVNGCVLDGVEGRRAFFGLRLVSTAFLALRLGILGDLALLVGGFGWGSGQDFV